MSWTSPWLQGNFPCTTMCEYASWSNWSLSGFKPPGVSKLEKPMWYSNYGKISPKLVARVAMKVFPRFQGFNVFRWHKVVSFKPVVHTQILCWTTINCLGIVLHLPYLNVRLFKDLQIFSQKSSRKRCGTATTVAANISTRFEIHEIKHVIASERSNAPLVLRLGSFGKSLPVKFNNRCNGGTNLASPVRLSACRISIAFHVGHDNVSSNS